MKILLTIALVVVAVIVGLLVYIGWFLRRAVTDTTRVSAEVQASGPKTLEIVITTSGASGPVSITEISLPRSLREEMDLQPPPGFVLEPLPLTEEEQRDADAVKRAGDYNRKKARYVGSFSVPPNAPAVLTFPVERKSGSGRIGLQYEHKIGVGGQIGFASVQVGAHESAAEQADAAEEIPVD